MKKLQFKLGAGDVMNKVSVVGLGYIGLPSAILFAQSGYKVFGFDVDQNKVKKINSSQPTILEPEIIKRLSFVVNSKSFSAFNSLEPADVFVIAVPTPFKKDFGFNGIKKADLSYVLDAFENISKVLKPGNLVILESTVPVGTTEYFANFLEHSSGLKVSKDFFVAHCPERVLPGKIFWELENNDRIIGGVCKKSSILAKKFYSKFVRGRIYTTDSKTAEMVKLVENSSRDNQIAFANQVSDMCKSSSIDPFKVIEFANMHPRVNILNPGCGVGGHCIAVDPWFLIESFPENTELLKLSRKINDKRPHAVINKIIKEVNLQKDSGKKKPKVLTLGLTFKPDVDDLRGSPALKIANSLNKMKAFFELKVFDNNVPPEFFVESELHHCNDLALAIAWADIIVVLVKHKLFLSINRSMLNEKKVIDETGLLHSLEKKKYDISFESNSNVKKGFINV